MKEKMRVYQLAREMLTDSKVILRVLNQIGVEAKNHMSTMEEDVAEKVRDILTGKVRLTREQPAPQPVDGKEGPGVQREAPRPQVPEAPRSAAPQRPQPVPRRDDYRLGPPRTDAYDHRRVGGPGQDRRPGGGRPDGRPPGDARRPEGMRPPADPRRADAPRPAASDHRRPYPPGGARPDGRSPGDARRPEGTRPPVDPRRADGPRPSAPDYRQPYTPGGPRPEGRVPDARRPYPPGGPRPEGRPPGDTRRPASDQRRDGARPPGEQRRDGTRPAGDQRRSFPPTGPRAEARPGPGDARRPQPAQGQRPVSRPDQPRGSDPRRQRDDQWRGDREDRERRPSRRGEGPGGYGRGRRPDRGSQPPAAARPRGPRSVTIEGPLPVKELASKMGMLATDLMRRLIAMGIMASINQDLDADTGALVASELGFEVVQKTPELSLEEKFEQEFEEPDDPALARTRPPVVTVMGHVDHGKTSLLDAIRHTNVTAREAGGITQHIGASVTEHNGKRIVFLDTPGHEAFTTMRARGAKVTDIAVLVVAADDGVMPQTIEALNHARAAGVPVVVAINKMDRPNARPDRVKQQLAEHGLVPEEWGGETIFAPVSATEGTGIQQLLEMILLVAEIGELKADPTRKARGTVIEAQLDKGRGPVATVLIHTGTLKVGDAFVTGMTSGRVRAMTDAWGRRVKRAGPSMPVEVVGMNDVPQAGDNFMVIEEERLAKDIAESRQVEKRQKEMETTRRLTLDDLFNRVKEGEVSELNLVIKADVQGSVEAVRQALEKLGQGEVRPRMIHSGVGAITESDIMLAAASNAIVIGFNVRPDANARRVAEDEKVDVRTYRIIYEAIQDIEAALKGMLKPKWREVVTGRAEVRAVFRIPKVGTVAGCYVTEGKIDRTAAIRVIRNGVVINESKLSSLKRFKDDVREVNSGFECGIGIEKFQDVKEGDVLEAFTSEEIKTA
ncbi:MAG: translation initiation factor IF-2 [Bacillota bacterium]